MHKEQLSTEIIVRCSPKGCMMNELVKDWLLMVWNRRPEVLLRKRNAVLGCIYGTPNTQNKRCSYWQFTNTDLVIVMGGITSQLQVLDVVNKPFKDHLKQLYSEWLLTRYHALNPPGRIKKHVVIPVCQWLFRAWHCISPAAFVEARKQCCISSELDWTMMIHYGMIVKRKGY
jgi:hypothetical protein